MDSRTISIIGGGLMGHSIALVFAKAGHRVVMSEPNPAVRDQILVKIGDTLDELGCDRAALERISVTATLATCVAEANWVIEAAPENLEIKRAIFAEAARAAPPDAILASNTSVIPISQIMVDVADRTRALGTHWWNPAYLIPLVEVVRTTEASDAAVSATLALLTDAGKKPVEIKKDIPGFVGNRLQHALWREAIALVEQGVCDARTVDDVVKSSFGARLGVLGPLENADLVGLDLTRAIHSYIFPTLNSSTTPSTYLDALIADGRLGFKTGRGFSDWSAQAQAKLRSEVFDRLKDSFGVSSPSTDVQK